MACRSNDSLLSYLLRFWNPPFRSRGVAIRTKGQPASDTSSGVITKNEGSPTSDISSEARRSRLPRPARQRSVPYDGVRDGRITKKWAGREKERPSRGLHNTATNFCYRNATLQCLIHLPEFCDYLKKIHSFCAVVGKHCLVCALQDLVWAYWSGVGMYGTGRQLTRFNRAVKACIPEGHLMEEDIKYGHQSDPFEFLQYLLEALEDEGLPADDLNQSDLFTIEHEVEWTCEDCGKVHIPNEQAVGFGHGLGVALNIQNPQNGLTMLEYLRCNEYSEECDIRCESAECIANFGKKAEGRTRIRRKFIIQAPEILVIRLVRYTSMWDYEEQEQVQTKIADNVIFEEYLDLREFTRSEEHMMYQLQRVVAHNGETIGSGHYIAAVRKADGKSFCSINDDVKIGKEMRGCVEELEFPTSRGEDFTPYVLFYSKI
ncbi:hypothetical protein LTR37_014063 [Vermiconidia calcicola]|uniref:Uncharacterized protein n=1 Tax=Vermiconidia calcicola TaxID=1690605 RepID=A0ACC3MW71_9PEZI|nr:hypothetical protein LTR37_014063 [Vermiconidia calcicola]